MTKIIKNRRIGEKLLTALQQPCLLCGDGCDEDSCLCMDCLNGLPFLSHTCEQCGIPISGSALRCGACISTEPYYSHCISVLDYRSPVDYLIKHMKYHNQISVAHLMSKLLAQKIQKTNIPLPEMLIPVPLHTNRLQQRGYNQALEIARPLSRELRIPVNITHCVRSRNTEPQFELPRQKRSENIKNAFEVISDLSANHVAIIDDVMTTGSTVNEFSRVLRQAGVKKVDVWACARATL